MTAELDEVRRAVAARHGLAENAVGFLVGSTLAELEASAGELGELIATQAGRDHPEPEPAPLSIIDQARAGQARRKQELAAMFAGRPTATNLVNGS